MAPTYVLVHGGQQGSWAFDLLVPELHKRGRVGIAVDLPIGDPDAGADAYANVIIRSIAEIPGEIVLVGHSMSGLVIPLVASRRAISRLVFVCAAYPEPGRSHMDVKASQPGEAVAEGPASAWHQPGEFHLLPPEAARAYFFDDCPAELQDWAISRMRPQARKPLREITPLTSWPDTPSTLIIAADDRCIPKESAVRTAARLFGVRPIEIPGGHCPSVSRPARLADVMVRAAG
jgi:pimeloyl-ACP methyl ester carboxylesterase